MGAQGSCPATDLAPWPRIPAWTPGKENADTGLPFPLSNAPRPIPCNCQHPGFIALAAASIQHLDRAPPLLSFSQPVTWRLISFPLLATLRLISSHLVSSLVF